MTGHRVIRNDKADEPGRVRRFDVGRIGKLERTPTGGVRVDARISRTGILVYQTADGTTIREYRPPEEAFHTDSLRSLEDAIVTVGHPASGTMVTPENAKALGVGIVKTEGREDAGRFVLTKLAITDGPTIARIDRRELSDVSAGYTCEVEMTPGTTPTGERYDAVQRGVIYNHVALLPPGGGRAGAEVALKMDARTAVAVLEEGAPPRVERNDEGRRMKTETIDGVEYEVGTAAWAQAHAKRLAKFDADKAAMQAALDAKTGELEAMKKGLAEKEAEVQSLRDALESECSEEKTDARAAVRAALLDDAHTILGPDEKGERRSFAGQSSETIRRAMIAKLDGKDLLGPDGKPAAVAVMEAYLAGRVATFRKDAKTSTVESPIHKARAGILTGAPGTGGVHLDAADPETLAILAGVPSLSDKWKGSAL